MNTAKWLAWCAPLLLLGCNKSTDAVADGEVLSVEHYKQNPDVRAKALADCKTLLATRTQPPANVVENCQNAGTAQAYSTKPTPIGTYQN